MKTARQAEHLGYDIETVRIETVTMNKLRDGDIPFGRKGGEQIETLEDEADFVAAQFGSPGVPQFGTIIPAHQDPSPGSPRQPRPPLQQPRHTAAPTPPHSHR